MSKSLLQHPKSLGGMSLPNFQCYYWASNIHPILHWLYEDPGADAVSWVAIEYASCLPSSLAALVYAPLSFPGDKFTKNLLVRSTLKIWKQVRCHFGWQTMSPKSPVHSNHVFNPWIIDKSFASWYAKGIRAINDLYYEGVFCSFQQMCEQYNISKNHFFSIISKSMTLYIKCSSSFLLHLPVLHLIIYWRVLQDGRALYQHCTVKSWPQSIHPSHK